MICMMVLISFLLLYISICFQLARGEGPLLSLFYSTTTCEGDRAPSYPGNHRSPARLQRPCNRSVPEGRPPACRVCRQSVPVHRRSGHPIFHGSSLSIASICLLRYSGSLYFSFSKYGYGFALISNR